VPPSASPPASPAPTQPAGATSTPTTTSASPGPADPFQLAHSLELPGPDSLATALSQAEAGIHSPATSPSALADLGRIEQAACRQLFAHPEWRDGVLARLPEWQRPIVRADVDASVELRAITPPRTSLPNWRIIAPRPQAELLADYQQAQAASGVPWQYLAAINLVETRMGRIVGLSSGGARGPMQFIPSTWARYGRGDIENAHDAILAAGRFLSTNGAPANMSGALFAYNPSQHYVRAVTLYAQQMQADPRAFGGYYNWLVYVSTTRGDALLPEGYGA
jgi:membrane-bound lytic murein transglycosylase B